MSLKVIMFGAGDFAVPTLRALYASPHPVVAVYTQPDRGGPGRHQHVPLMKSVALEHGTPVHQPVKVNAPEELDILAQYQADLYVVAAYGQILSRKFLALPPRGSYNVHASLLPKYRGASPIQAAILHGETESGVSIIEVQPALDAGPVLAIESLPIGPWETAGELEERLAALGARLLVQVLDDVEAGRARGVAQNDAEATYAPKLTKERGAIDWQRPAVELACHVRSMQPWPTPSTHLFVRDLPPKRVVLRRVQAVASTSTHPPGTIVAVAKDRLAVQTGDGWLDILQIQPEGKRTLDVAEFLRGTPVQLGDRCGPAGRDEGRGARGK